MDPNSRYGDDLNTDHCYGNEPEGQRGLNSDTRKRAHMAWTVEETLDDIEFPDVDLNDEETQSELDTDNFKGVDDLLKENSSADIDEMFQSATPGNTAQMKNLLGGFHQGQGDWTEIMEADLMAFTPDTKKKETPLIEFTP